MMAARFAMLPAWWGQRDTKKDSRGGMVDTQRRGQETVRIVVVL